MSETRRHPSDEEIAAFAAGELRGAERSRFIEQLNRDPESYQLLLETIELLEPSGVQDEETDEDEVTPFTVDSKRLSASSWRVAALAASAVLAVGLGWLIYTFLPQPAGSIQLAAQLSESLSSQMSAGDLNALTWNEESAQGFAGGSASQASFRLGLLLLDLEIARRASDLSRGETLLLEIEKTLTAQQAGPVALEKASEARGRVDSQQSLAGLERFPEQIIPSLPARWDPFFLSFGHWAEAARLASLQQQQGFFQQTAFQEFARQLSGREGLNSQIRGTWGEIQSLLRKPSLGPDDWEELAQKWAFVIRLV